MGVLHVNIMEPSPALLCKLASIAVHAEEMTSPYGHQFDEVALASALEDPEVCIWLAGMVKAGMAPVKR